MALKALAPLHTTQMRVCSTPADPSRPHAPLLARTHCCVMATSVAAASVDAGHCILAMAAWDEAWDSCQRWAHGFSSYSLDGFSRRSTLRD